MRLFRSGVGLLIIGAGLAATPEVPAAEEAVRCGTLRGRVMRSDGSPAWFSNIVIRGTRSGAMSDEEGRFRLDELAAGRHLLRVQALGCRPLDTLVTFDPAAAAELRLELDCRGITILGRQGLDSALAARESIGVDSRVRPGDLVCSITPLRSTFRVGDTPAFQFRILNRSGRALLLVRSLDGSAEDRRSPRVDVTIRGPAGALRPPPSVACGNMNSLADGDFFELAPGAAFDPLEQGFRPLILSRGVFPVPGRYQLTFTYSTNEPDVRRWLGWPEPTGVSKSLSAKLRRVPRVDLSCVTEFDVVE